VFLQLSHENIECCGARPQMSTGQDLEGYTLVFWSYVIVKLTNCMRSIFLNQKKKTKKLLVAILDYVESAPLNQQGPLWDPVFTHVSDLRKSSNVKSRV